MTDGWMEEQGRNCPPKIDALARDGRLPGCQASLAAGDHWREDSASRIGFQTQTAGMDYQTRQQESGRAGINVHLSCNKRRDFLGPTQSRRLDPRKLVQPPCGVRSKYRSAVPRAVAHPGPTGADTLRSVGEEKQKRSKNLLVLGYILRQHVLDPPGFPLQCDPSFTLLGSLCADGWVLDKLPGCICSAGMRPGMNMSRRTTVWWNYH